MRYIAWALGRGLAMRRETEGMHIHLHTNLVFAIVYVALDLLTGGGSCPRENEQ